MRFPPGRVFLSAGQVRALADRHRGVGFDQLLLVESAVGAQADFRYRIFNADGGEVGRLLRALPLQAFLHSVAPF